MRNLKRIISLFILLIFGVILGIVTLPANEVQAADTTYTDSGDSNKDASYKVNEESEVNHLPYGVVHYRHQGESTSKALIGKDVDGAGPVNAYVTSGVYYAQQINVLEVPSTPGVKLIPWMNYTDNKWNRTTNIQIK